MKRFLTIFCLLAFLGVSQSYGSNYYTTFFRKYKDGLASKVLLKFASPTNDYTFGRCYMKYLNLNDPEKRYIIVNIQSVSWGSEKERFFKIYMNEQGDFIGIEVYKDNKCKILDDGAFFTAEIATCALKALTIKALDNIIGKILGDLMDNVFSNYKSEVLGIIRRLYSNRIEKLSAKEICLACLNYLMSKNIGENGRYISNNSM